MFSIKRERKRVFHVWYTQRKNGWSSRTFREEKSCVSHKRKEKCRRSQRGTSTWRPTRRVVTTTYKPSKGRITELSMMRYLWEYVYNETCIDSSYKITLTLCYTTQKKVTLTTFETVTCRVPGFEKGTLKGGRGFTHPFRTRFEKTIMS